MAAVAAKKSAKPKAAKSAKKVGKPASKKSVDTASAAVDEQLARYRSMRDFKITAEPAGG